MSACAVALAASATLGSPAGSQTASLIAYNGESIAVIRPDGQLVDESFYTGCPSWSPDGRRFAAADTPVGDERLYIVEVGAGPDHAVARASLYNHGRPSWSPDGKQLVFNVDGGRLLIARADGRGTRVLTKPPIRRTVAVEDWDPHGLPTGSGSHSRGLDRTSRWRGDQGRPRPPTSTSSGPLEPASGDWFEAGAHRRGRRTVERSRLRATRVASGYWRSTNIVCDRSPRRPFFRASSGLIVGGYSLRSGHPTAPQSRFRLSCARGGGRSSWSVPTEGASAT